MTEHAAGDARRLPRWAELAERALAEASSRVRVVGAATPVGWAAEIERLVACWSAGGAEAPSFTYAPRPELGPVEEALERLAATVAREPGLGPLYAARARELCDEARVVGAVGDAVRMVPCARRRFATRDAHDAEADALAGRWSEEAPAVDRAGAAPEGPDGRWVTSDDEADPRSLVSRLRGELGARRLPVRVVVASDLASLAATGDGVVQVAAKRRMTVVDVERTVHHEIVGHVEPRVLAQARPAPLFAVGTARGTDDQEGRALAGERAAGYFDAGRRAELALRHLAARATLDGAPFVDVVRMLSARGASLRVSIRVAARAQRGGGLGREVVYLPALLRHEAATREHGWIDDVLGRGRVAIDAAPVLRDWL